MTTGQYVFPSFTLIVAKDKTKQKQNQYPPPSPWVGWSFKNGYSGALIKTHAIQKNE